MECKDVRYWLCSYLDSELEPDLKKSLEEHLEVCPVCRSEVETCRSIKRMVQKNLAYSGSLDSIKNLKNRVISELERAEEYRESGVQALDLIRWGTHIAQLYNSKDDLTEILVPYMVKGLEENELCVWITSDISENEAIINIKNVFPDVYKCMDKGQLQILSYKKWYLPGGYFEGKTVLNSGLKKCQEAISSGYSGLRVTGSAYWLDQSNWDSFMEFETIFDNSISDYKALVICAYKENRYTKDNIADVMSTHKYLMYKTENLWRLKKTRLPSPHLREISSK